METDLLAGFHHSGTSVAPQDVSIPPMMLPTDQERKEALSLIHKEFAKNKKIRFLRTRHHWSKEHQRGTIRGFIWSSKLVFVQAYQWTTEDFTLVYQLSQDHDFSAYYRAVFRFVPTVLLPHKVVKKITDEPYISNLIYGVVDMSKISNNKTKEKGELTEKEGDAMTRSQNQPKQKEEMEETEPCRDCGSPVDKEIYEDELGFCLECSNDFWEHKGKYAEPTLT